MAMSNGGLYENVSRLDVAVNHVSRVEVAEAKKQLEQNPGAAIRVLADFVPVLVEATHFKVRHDYGGVAIPFLQREDGRNVRLDHSEPRTRFHRFAGARELLTWGKALISVYSLVRRCLQSAYFLSSSALSWLASIWAFASDGSIGSTST